MEEQIELGNEDVWDDTELIKQYDKGLKQWRKEKEQLAINSEDVPEIGQWTSVVDPENTEELPADPSSEGDWWDEYEAMRCYYKAVNISGSRIPENKVEEDIQVQLNQDEEQVETDTIEASSIQPSFSVGSSCRTQYKGDGKIYEAKIIEILESGLAIIQLIGFENEVQVALNDLLPSLGNE